MSLSQLDTIRSLFANINRFWVSGFGFGVSGFGLKFDELEFYSNCPLLIHCYYVANRIIRYVS